MGPVGIPEVFVLLAVAAFWVIPVAAGVWALVTLHRIRVGQDELRHRLSTIERGLQSKVSG
jgi:hypothetical protein